MTILLGILTFFLILALLVLVHELGHFSMAKLFGVRVDEFGVGFPPRIRGWRRGQTLYSINAIPLGGFVKMTGENGRSDAPDSFGAKPAWQRFIILIAGPTMNLLLAIGIFFFSFLHGIPKQLGTTDVAQVTSGTPAAVAGIHTGDRIVTVDGQKVSGIADLHTAVDVHLGQLVKVTVLRGRSRVNLTVLARRHHPANQGAFGIVLGKTVTQRYSPGESLTQSAGIVGSMVSQVPEALNTLVAPRHNNTVVGPIGIAHITTDTVQQEPQQGPTALLALIALLSANLGVLNLLPVPALDGGRIVFVLVSVFRRRGIDPQIEGAIHAAGMAVLLLLILVVSYKDLAHWISGGSI